MTSSSAIQHDRKDWAYIIGEAESYAEDNWGDDLETVGDYFTHPQVTDPSNEEWESLALALVNLLKEERDRDE